MQQFITLQQLNTTLCVYAKFLSRTDASSCVASNNTSNGKFKCNFIEFLLVRMCMASSLVIISCLTSYMRVSTTSTSDPGMIQSLIIPLSLTSIFWDAYSLRVHVYSIAGRILVCMHHV